MVVRASALKYFGLLMCMLAGCDLSHQPTVVVQDCSVASLGKPILDLVVEGAASNGWKSVRVVELPSSRNGKRYLNVSPIVDGPEKFGDDFTLVVAGGLVVEEYDGR